MEVQQNNALEQGKTAKAEAPAVQNVKLSNSSTDSITQTSQKVNKPSNKAKKTKKGLNNMSNVRTLSIKVYAEQLPYGEEELYRRIRELDKQTEQVIAIKHDRDTTGDSFWEIATEKAHYHILWRSTNRKPKHVCTILNMLGIQFRPGIDDILMTEHGVETIARFDNMVVYLMHETAEAIADGKEPYSIEELVSNLTIDEIQQVIDGYIRINNSDHKVGFDQLQSLDEQAYNLGYNLKDFDTWYNSLNFATRSNAKMKVIKESYQRGLEARATEPNDRCVIRTCIFVQGAPNTGKSYASKKVCTELGKPYIEISGGGTGKFDKLKPSHKAIILDDDVMPNLLNMTDNYIVPAYRRNSNNPYWCGDLIIVTSNLPFNEWLEKCGIHTQEWIQKEHRFEWTEHYKALKSRFYICRIDDIFDHNFLNVRSVSTRGTAEEQTIRKENFKKIRDIYNRTLGEYRPSTQTVDYSDVL